MSFPDFPQIALDKLKALGYVSSILLIDNPRRLVVALFKEKTMMLHGPGSLPIL